MINELNPAWFLTMPCFMLAMSYDRELSDQFRGLIFFNRLAAVFSFVTPLIFPDEKIRFCVAIASVVYVAVLPLFVKSLR